MRVLEDVDEEFPTGTEFLRRICTKFKFVAEGGSIYTEAMTATELDRVQESIRSMGVESTVIPVLFHLSERSIYRTDDPTSTKHRLRSYLSSVSLPDFGDVNNSPQSSSTLPASFNQPVPEDDQHPEKQAQGFYDDDYDHELDHDYDHAYDSYDSSEGYADYNYSDDGDESTDTDISSPHFDPDMEGPTVLGLIPSILGSGGSRSTSTGRKGSSATESYWSGKSGYRSYGERKGSVFSHWSFGAGSGTEGRQHSYYPEELGIALGDSASVSASVNAHEDDWRRLLGPAQIDSLNQQAMPVPPESPTFADPGELEDSFASSSAQETTTSEFDINHITGFDQQPDFISVASAATGSTSLSSPTFSSVSFISAPHSQSGSSVSGSASGSSGPHNRSQSRSTFIPSGMVGSTDRTVPLPPPQMYQQKKSAPGSYQNPWELMQKTPFSKSPLGAGAKGRARERPPSMMSAASMRSLGSSFNFSHDDTFAPSLNAWGGQTYQDLRKDWVFRKERSERSRDTSSHPSNSNQGRSSRRVQLGMPVPSQEYWKNFLLGKFVVIREEVGGDGVGLGHSRVHSKSFSKSHLSSADGSLAESKSGMSRRSTEKGYDSENASLSSVKSSKDKGKAREEIMTEGLAKAKLSNDIRAYGLSLPPSFLSPGLCSFAPYLSGTLCVLTAFHRIDESKGRPKTYKSKSSSYSQSTTVTVKPQRSSDYGSGKPPQQRLVIRKLNSQPREPGERHKAEISTSSSTALGSHTSRTSKPPTSPMTPPAEGIANSPVITVSPPRSPSNPAEVSTTSMQASGSGSSSRSEPPPPPPHMLSHPLGYDPLHPAVIVHKHSKVAAFSFSRHHRSSWARGSSGNAPNSSAHRSRTVIMLASRSVQEAFTNTETTKRFMETALLMNFENTARKREKERTLGGSERDKRKDKEKEKEKEKGKKKASKDNLRLKIRSEGQVHLDEDGRESPIKSSAKSRSKLPYPRSPTTKTSGSLGTKSALANVNEANEDDSGDGAASESPTDNPLDRRPSSAALSVLVPSTSGSSAGVDDKGTDIDPIYPPPKPRVADHHKSYGTFASHRNLDPPQSSQSAPRSRRSSNSNRLKHLIPWGDNSIGNSTSDLTSSSNTLVESTPSLNSANDTTGYIPPWLTIPTREQQEIQRKAEDAMGNLKMSFENISLLPSLREAGEQDKSKDREGNERNSLRQLTGKEKEREKEKDDNVLNVVPRDSLFMLLPLWPGETDPYAQRYFPFEMPAVPTEERILLLVYYKVLSTEVLSNLNQSTPFPPIQDKRNILLPCFQIVGRKVSYTELLGSGIRLPDQGLAVSGPLEEAHNTAPKLQGGPLSAAPSSSSSLPQIPSPVGTIGRELVMGTCYSRDAGIEFDPYALTELGLCNVLEENAAPYSLPLGMSEEEIKRSSTVKLTAIGSAVVEMVWAGGLALTSFEPVDEKGEAGV
ncbi:hypothetical protein AAF712_004841 [Marasmius tenuissimus]|uniref:Mediator of RNA polymerase II transcription subunit 13 n=1 Tax=Marasmius tenuissimus TaxID=585030 RepID=A0ABR3A2G9_9AGAR